MKISGYKYSKIRTVGFVLIAAATALTVMDIVSPDVRAEPADSANQAALNQVHTNLTQSGSDGTVKIAKNTSGETQKSLYVKQENQDGVPNPTPLPKRTTTNAAAEPEKTPQQSDNGSSYSSQESSKDADVNSTKTSNSSNTSSGHYANREACHDTCTGVVQVSTPQKTSTTTYHQSSTARPTPSPTAMPEPHISHHQPAKQPKVEHAEVVYKDVPVNVDTSHQHTTTHTKVVHEPTQEVHYTDVQNHYYGEEQPDQVVYVAAEQVEAPAELPSTGPGLATVISLGGIISALVARKLFRL